MIICRSEVARLKTHTYKHTAESAGHGCRGRGGALPGSGALCAIAFSYRAARGEVRQVRRNQGPAVNLANLAGLARRAERGPRKQAGPHLLD